MRIIAGQYKGRRLQVLKNKDIRPTSDKIRGAIFNALQSRIDIEGAAVLDAFCGTGALGLEALSRGAAFCVFMDKSRDSLRLAQENAAVLLDENQQTNRFVLGDATQENKIANIGQVFDIVFLDPPYAQGLIQPVIDHIIHLNMISPDGVFVIESEKSWSAIPSGLVEVLHEKIYSDTKITFVRMASS